MTVDRFVIKLEKFGFQLVSKDIQKEYFNFLDFKKISDVKKKKKLPELSLKACVYKKR